MPNNYESLTFATLPKCDFCTDNTFALYGGKTVMGPWANMCIKHFIEYGTGLGLGKGRRYILKSDD